MLDPFAPNEPAEPYYKIILLHLIRKEYRWLIQILSKITLSSSVTTFA